MRPTRRARAEGSNTGLWLVFAIVDLREEEVGRTGGEACFESERATDSARMRLCALTESVCDQKTGKTSRFGDCKVSSQCFENIHDSTSVRVMSPPNNEDPCQSDCTCSRSAQLAPCTRQEAACGSQVRWVDAVVRLSCPQLE